MDIISREEAKKRGLTRYFTGIPCKSGHVCERYISHGCVECQRGRAVYNKEWREKNKEKRKPYDREKYLQNYDAVRERTREWYKNNTERYYVHQKNWQKRNPDATKARSHRHRARKRDADGFYTAEDVKRIYKQQKGKCAYCGHSLKSKYEIDHIVALANGGSNWPSNIQLTCLKDVNSCNQSKGAKDPIDFAQSRGLLL